MDKIVYKFNKALCKFNDKQRTPTMVDVVFGFIIMIACGLLSQATIKAGQEQDNMVFAIASIIFLVFMIAMAALVTKDVEYICRKKGDIQ